MLIPDKYKNLINKIAEAFTEYEILLVGGSVRDLLQEREPKDFDFTTSAIPEQTKDILLTIADLNKNNEPMVYEWGSKYGTLGAIIDGQSIEITTYRVEQYSEGRKPEVQWGKSFFEDSARRDFTMNSMGYDIKNNELIDHWGGQMGIRTKSLSMVGMPVKRIQEDPLRMLRAIRFAAKDNLTIDTETTKAIKENAKLIETLSKERKRDELTKILMTDNPDQGVRNLVDLGLMQYLIPEVNDMINLQQPTKFHNKDVYNHSLTVLKNVEPQIRLRWAALLHDIGKPHTYTINDGVIHYYGHQDEGAKMAYQILKRFAFGNEDIAAICHLVRQHMNAHRLTKNLIKDGIDVKNIAEYKNENGVSYKTVEKFVNKLDYWKNYDGIDKLLVSAEDVMKLNRADIMGSAPNRIAAGLKKFEITKKMVETVRENRANPRPKLPINGNDLIKKFNLEQGKDLGDVLKHLNSQLEDGVIGETEADKAFSLAQKYLVEEKHYPLVVSPVTGDELMKKFNIKPGKDLGNILKSLKNMVREGELKGWEKDKAYIIVENMLKKVE